MDYYVSVGMHTRSSPASQRGSFCTASTFGVHWLSFGFLIDPAYIVVMYLIFRGIPSNSSLLSEAISE